MKKLLFATLLLSAGSFAECPVEVTAFRLTPYNQSVRVELKNKTHKVITAFDASVEFMDEWDTRHKAQVDFNQTKLDIKPGKKGIGAWRYVYKMQERGTVTVNQVTFADGTQWVDDGSGACKGENTLN